MSKGQKPFFRQWQIITISACAPGFAFVHAIWRTIHVKGTLFIPNFITEIIIISIYITVPMVLESVVLRIVDKKRNSGSKGEET